MILRIIGGFISHKNYMEILKGLLTQNIHRKNEKYIIIICIFYTKIKKKMGEKYLKRAIIIANTYLSFFGINVSDYKEKEGGYTLL